ncbi:hypothetical protein [Nonomuraea guangzhouensis]|uniref:Tetratricopeptide repeat protein n=1 Tax=Nonomuraea guangzhouensis TaxID=1291555 RepID=A0ABW4GFM7_9ACTN|nr:hypothetical protein [Nonomuraea guangzhouensis]
MRRVWLHGMVPFDAGPYEQAARVFRQHGHPAEAERLLIERKRARRAPPPGGRTPRSSRSADAPPGTTIAAG